ncbi:insecticidal delta-endotoxin Cry8Ea1 family protein, partial [Xanthovirga aplysinae]|uniref:insecticidal delta-endotoxin Cry8Ea1 family protein n=1 Tax=Xanthovirga aplysinae TaxID=2529853 RepID=UPI001CA39698
LQGDEWGIGQVELDRSKRNLENAIPVFSDYVDRWYQTGLNQAVANAPKPNAENTEPFNTINKYVREMTLAVLDFRDMWPYFDPIKYPDGAEIRMDREIYSDMIGSSPTPFVFPSGPSEFPTRVQVWAGQRVDAIQVDYPSNGGPEGKTSIKIGGSGGVNTPEAGGDFDVKDKPIIGASADSFFNVYNFNYGSAISGLKFYFKDQLESSKMGREGNLSNKPIYSYPEHILSSIYIPAVDYKALRTGLVQSIIFGFKPEKSVINTNIEVLKSVFLGNPNPLTPEQLADLGNISVSQASDLIDDWHDEHVQNWGR